MKTSIQLMNKKVKKNIKRAGIILFWIMLWALAAQWVNSPLVLPSPFNTIRGVVTLVQLPEFYSSMAITLVRVFLGVLMSFMTGLIWGIIGGLNKNIYELLNPFVATIKSLPVVSVIILINLWIASGLVPLVVTFLICFPITWTNITQGIGSTDEKLLEMARLYKVPRLKVLKDIYLPSLRPYGVSALVSAIGLGWKVTVTAEVLANALPSVGMNLYYARIYLETDLLFSWTLVIVVCSFAIEKLTLLGLNRKGKNG